MSFSSDDYKLELVQIYFRHGDRAATEAELYKDDPYENIFKKIGCGQLTKKGMKRMYETGKMFRQRYKDFLKDSKFDNFHSQSTNVDRTKMSLQLVLAGLNPPTPDTRFSEDLNWLPMPMNHKELQKDYFNFIDSPKIKVLGQQLFRSPGFAEKTKKYKDLVQRIKDEKGISSPVQLTFIFANVHSALKLGLPLPKWCSSEDYEKLKEMNALLYDSLADTDFFKRITAGPMVEEMIDNIMKNDKDNKIKMYLYCVHDFNVGVFLAAHNVFRTFVEFGSAIIVEKLRGKDNKVYIRILLWSAEHEKMIPIKLGNFGHECPFDHYLKIAESIVPNDEARKFIPNDKDGEESGEKSTSPTSDYKLS